MQAHLAGMAAARWCPHSQLSELAGQQARLAADLAAMEDVIRGAVQLCQGPPHEQQQQQAPDAFLAESARLLHEARLAATKVRSAPATHACIASHRKLTSAREQGAGP